MVFKLESEKAYSRLPVCRERLGRIWHLASSPTPPKTLMTKTNMGPSKPSLCSARNKTGLQSLVSSHWAPGVFTRMAIASCTSLGLQWGTVGAAFVVGWFTPTTEMGCRAMGYLLYGNHLNF
ncbi:hypothetical protein BDR07DRAFT_883719 [Suillus spraguei]|nr:hypothetical protein BDR07DRAFT_883719 [Suillus spraguei]